MHCPCDEYTISGGENIAPNLMGTYRRVDNRALHDSLAPYGLVYQLEGPFRVGNSPVYLYYRNSDWRLGPQQCRFTWFCGEHRLGEFFLHPFYHGCPSGSIPPHGNDPYGLPIQETHPWYDTGVSWHLRSNESYSFLPAPDLRIACPSPPPPVPPFSAPKFDYDWYPLWNAAPSAPDWYKSVPYETEISLLIGIVIGTILLCLAYCRANGWLERKRPVVRVWNDPRTPAAVGLAPSHTAVAVAVTRPAARTPFGAAVPARAATAESEAFDGIGL